MFMHLYQLCIVAIIGTLQSLYIRISFWIFSAEQILLPFYGHRAVLAEVDVCYHSAPSAVTVLKGVDHLRYPQSVFVLTL